MDDHEDEWMINNKSNNLMPQIKKMTDKKHCKHKNNNNNY